MEKQQGLIEQLRKAKCLWSYTDDSYGKIADDVLIEKTLVYLDMPEIMQLFEIFPKKKIKKVWMQRLIPQGEYLHQLNRFFAWYLFGIKRPDAYLKSMETRHINSLLR